MTISMFWLIALTKGHQLFQMPHLAFWCLCPHLWVAMQKVQFGARKVPINSIKRANYLVLSLILAAQYLVQFTFWRWTSSLSSHLTPAIFKSSSNVACRGPNTSLVFSSQLDNILWSHFWIPLPGPKPGKQLIPSSPYGSQWADPSRFMGKKLQSRYDFIFNAVCKCWTLPEVDSVFMTCCPHPFPGASEQIGISIKRIYWCSLALIFKPDKRDLSLRISYLCCACNTLCSELRKGCCCVASKMYALDKKEHVAWPSTRKITARKSWEQRQGHYNVGCGYYGDNNHVPSKLSSGLNLWNDSHQWFMCNFPWHFG